MFSRTLILLAIVVSLAGCNRLAYQSSVHVRLKDETKTIADLTNALSTELNLKAHKTEFDYGGSSRRQTVYELTGPSNVIFVQTESGDFCSDRPDPDHPTFNDRLLVVNLSASTEEGLAAAVAALKQVSAANGGLVLGDSKQVCR